MIQEISSSSAAEQKRSQMACSSSSSSNPKSDGPVRKGTTDYSKWDAIDSDDDEDDARRPKLPGVELPKVSRICMYSSVLESLIRTELHLGS